MLWKVRSGPHHGESQALRSGGDGDATTVSLRSMASKTWLDFDFARRQAQQLSKERPPQMALKRETPRAESIEHPCI